MIKIIVTFATFVSLAAPIASAHAWQLVNGRELNGRELNGMASGSSILTLEAIELPAKTR